MFSADNFNQNYLACGRAVRSADGGNRRRSSGSSNGTLVSRHRDLAARQPRGVVFDAIARRPLPRRTSTDLDLNYDVSDQTTVHFKAGWTKASGDTVNEYFLETAAPGTVAFDITTRAPAGSVISPDATSPPDMLIDFGRRPTVKNDDEEKYAYADLEQTGRMGADQRAEGRRQIYRP